MQKILESSRVPATILAGLGLFYTIYIHLNAFDYVDISEGDKIPEFLSLGLFGLWAIAIGVTINRGKQFKVSDPGFGARLKVFYQSLFGEAPLLIVIISVATYLYGTYYGWAYNFEGITGIIDGKLVLHNHGHIIKELSTDEFIQFKSQEIEVSTAHSMIFYGAAMGILFPSLQAK